MSLLTLVTVAALLNPVTTVSVPGVTHFNAQDHFVVDTNEDAPVKIVWLGKNFKEHFLDKVEQNLLATELTIHTLTKDSLDAPIRDELGEQAETSLAHLWHLLLQQGRGQQGSLLVNGYANAFFIRDKSGEPWGINARWLADDDSWGVEANSVSGSSRWNVGDQVVSRE